MNIKKKTERYNRVRRSIQPLIQVKKDTISQLASIGRKHKLLKYPIFLIATAFIFVYNLLLHTFISLRVRKEFARGLALALTVVLTLTSIDFTVFAMTSDSSDEQEKNGVIVEIQPLNDSTLVQRISVGSAPTDIYLPESISAKVNYNLESEGHEEKNIEEQDAEENPSEVDDLEKDGLTDKDNLNSKDEEENVDKDNGEGEESLDENQNPEENPEDQDEELKEDTTENQEDSEQAEQNSSEDSENSENDGQIDENNPEAGSGDESAGEESIEAEESTETEQEIHDAIDVALTGLWDDFASIFKPMTVYAADKDMFSEEEESEPIDDADSQNPDNHNANEQGNEDQDNGSKQDSDKGDDYNQGNDGNPQDGEENKGEGVQEVLPELDKISETENIELQLLWQLDAERSTSGQISFDSAGEYVFVASLRDDSLKLAEGVKLPEIKVIVVEERTSLKTVVGNIEIMLEAMPGVFPQGASINATQVENKEVISKIEELMERELGLDDESGAEQEAIKETVVFDVTVVDKNGNEVQPTIPEGYAASEAITLTFKQVVSTMTDGEGLDRSSGEKIQAFHVDDSINNVETVEADNTGMDMSIHPEHFSIYGFVLTGAESEVTLGNNGYPYGKNMSSSSITLVVDVEEGEATSYKWQSSTDKSTWTDMTVEGASSQSVQFTPTNGTWYRCKVNGVASREVKVVMPGQDGRSWTYPYSSFYISNGYMAYMVNGSIFDVTGMYEKGGTTYMLQTSFSRYWDLFSSSNAQPSEGSGGSAQLDKLLIGFDPENNFAVNFLADLQEGQQAFAFGCDTQLGNYYTSGGYSDSAALLAALNNDKSLFQIAMIGAASEEAAVDSDPAFVIAPITPNPLFWIGNYGSRKTYSYCTNTGRGYTNTDINGVNVAIAVEGIDSGMTMSWTNVESGGIVGFRFGVGSVADTGAKKASYTATSKKIVVPETDEHCYYAIFSVSESGEPEMIREWVKGNGGDLVFEDLVQNTSYIIKVVSETDYNNGNFDNTEDTEASTAIDPLHPEDTDEYKDQVIDPTFTITSRTITVENVQTGGYTYNLVDARGSNVFPEFIAPDSEGTVVFNNLTPGTRYFFIAKTADNQNSDQVEKVTLPAVTYNLNGKGSIYRVTYDIPVDRTDAANPVGSKIAAPISPMAAGYQFGGWYKLSSCTDDSIWNFETDTITENTTLYAKWIQHTYAWEFQQIDSYTVIATCKHTDPLTSEEVICSDHINPAKVELTTSNANYTGDVYAGANLLNTLSAVDSSNRISTVTYYTDSECSNLTNAADNGAATEGGAPKNCGTYYAQVIVKDTNGDVQGTLQSSFRINAKSLSSSSLVISPDSYQTSGTTVNASYTVKDGARTLIKDVDYVLDDISVTETDTIGTFIIKVNGIGNYYGSASKTWRVTDATPPTGRVSVDGLSDSTSFIASPNFDRFFNSERTVTIEASDAEVEASELSIGYLISNHALTLDVLKRYVDSKWTTVANGGSFNITHNGPAIVYVKVVDPSGNEGYISSMAFTIDTVNPSVYGVDNDGSYCSDANFRVADSGAGIASVKIDGVEKYRSGIVDYKITGGDSAFTHTIVVKDRANNETVITGIHLNVEDLHQWKEVGVSTEPTCTKAGEKQHECSVCKATKYTYIPKLGHSYDYADDASWDMVWELDKDEHNETHYYGTAYIRCARGCGHSVQVGDRTIATKVIDPEPTTTSEGTATYTISVVYRDTNGDIQTKDNLTKQTVLNKLSSQDIVGDNKLSTGVNVASGAPAVSVVGLNTNNAINSLAEDEKSKFDPSTPAATVKLDVYVYLDIQNVTGSVSTGDEDKLINNLKEALDENVEEDKLRIIDISMYKNVKKILVADNTTLSDAVDPITEYDGILNISIREADLGFEEVSSGNERIYIVSRGHDYGSGLEAEIIYEGPAVNGVIPISTSLLCPFAITYRDQPASSKPGNNAGSGSGSKPNNGTDLESAPDQSGNPNPDGDEGGSWYEGESDGGEDGYEHSIIPANKKQLANIVMPKTPITDNKDIVKPTKKVRSKINKTAQSASDVNNGLEEADIPSGITNEDNGSDNKVVATIKSEGDKVAEGGSQFAEIEDSIAMSQTDDAMKNVAEINADTVPTDSSKCHIHWIYLLLLAVYTVAQLLLVHKRENKKVALGVLIADVVAGGLLLIPGTCVIDYIAYIIELLAAAGVFVSAPRIYKFLTKNENL